MTARVAARPLTRAAFAPFGDVIETEGAQSYPINDGRCIRHHDLAAVRTLGEGARALISIFVSQPVRLPYALTLVERHPLGSQAFMPLQPDPFLVIVAPDEDGAPGAPLAFLAAPGQGVNYAPGVWHGVLTPLEREGRFLVVDRGGEGANLEEHRYPAPWIVTG